VKALNDINFDEPVPVLVKDFRSRTDKTAAAEPDRWYHITDNPKFELDPQREPEDNSIAIYDRGHQKGVYLSKSPEAWVNGHDYVRPYVAEIHAHPSLRDHPDMQGRYSGEMFVPAHHFDKLHVHRVIPLDAHVREEYHEHGWIEEHHGTEFDTGNEIKHQSITEPWRGPAFSGGYHYPGPDAREFTPEQHRHHKERALTYLRENRRFDPEDIEHLRQHWAARYAPGVQPDLSSVLAAKREELKPFWAARGYVLGPRSGMISLDIPPEVSRAIAHPGGVEDHHITMVYLGKDVDDDAFRRACARAKELSQLSGPLPISLRGIDSFEPSESSDGKRPYFVPAFLPGAGHQLRRELQDLNASEFKTWIPHVSLAYCDEDEKPPAPVPAVRTVIPAISVHRGDEVVHFPFRGDVR
jgi:hypothetical protein